MDYVEGLREQIRKRRYFGVFDLDLQLRENFVGVDDTAVIDAYVQSLGMKPIGQYCKAVKRETAHDILTDLLQFSLVSRREIIPFVQAENFASMFIAMFTTNPTFYSNIEFDKHQRMWLPNGFFVNASFEGGLIVLEDDVIGILWSQEED